MQEFFEMEDAEIGENCVIRRCGFRRAQENNPLFDAILDDDLTQLKSLVDAGESVNTKNRKHGTLLHLAITKNRVEIFDFLLNCDNIDIESVNHFGETPLLHVASGSFDVYFALELAGKGADVHAVDYSGFTFLHLVADSSTSDDMLLFCSRLIDKGVDVNAQCPHGRTPLYFACKNGNFNCVCMLLYCGADATIPCNEGILPLFAVSEYIPQDEQIEIQEMLFNHTFDDYKITIQLPILTEAMMDKSPLFLRIIENVEDVSYKKVDISNFRRYLNSFHLQHFRLFVSKFGVVVKEMIDSFPTMSTVLDDCYGWDIARLQETIEILIDNGYISDFIQKSDPSFPTISQVIKACDVKGDELVKEEIFKIIYVMLIYGLNVSSVDLDRVYDHYGHCELFRILLHMDININNDNNDKSKHIASLWYDLDAKIEDFSPSIDLFGYFNNSKLKEIKPFRKTIINKTNRKITKINNDDLIAKAKSLPSVPLLLELARNTARKFIVTKFHTKNSMQFYTVLKRLPIDEVSRSIIALERKLYYLA